MSTTAGFVLNGPERRRPEVTADFEFWWDGIAAGELRIQRCAHCQIVRHPPHVRCARCGSFDTDWMLAPPTATVHSYVVYHYPQLPGTSYPYAVGLIEVLEGIRVVMPLWPNDGAGIAIDAPVHLAWETDASGDPWPYYMLAER